MPKVDVSMEEKQIKQNYVSSSDHIFRAQYK